MSSNEFVTPIRSALAIELLSRKRAMANIHRNGDEITIDAAKRKMKDDIFAIKEAVHTIEFFTGYPILSRTRAAIRREGRHVN